MQKRCKRCDKLFDVKPSHYDKRTYCGRSCMSESYRESLTGENNPNYKGAAYDMVCPCGKKFSVDTITRGRKYCSTSCHIRYRDDDTERLKEISKLGAMATKEKWYGYKRETKKVIKANNTKRTPKYLKKCAVCGGEFRSYQNKTCSPLCSRVHRSRIQQGDKSHLWQGGKVDKAKRIRNSLPYKMWREQVYERDDYTCKMCGKRGGKLAAHHIRTFSTHPDLRLEVSNGITLCRACHVSIRWKEDDYVDQFELATRAS